MNSAKYILSTAARNEERFIEKPIQWIIVSDASTDKNDKIVMSYVEKFKNFASKAKAIMFICLIPEKNRIIHY